MITADFDLVPDDPWLYREALINAFRARQILPDDVENLSEDALRWSRPAGFLEPMTALSFAELRFRGDPGRPTNSADLANQARVLGEIVTRDELAMDLFGLSSQDNPELEGDVVDLPYVESIRSSRRIGPDGQVLFDLIAEVSQCRWINIAGSRQMFLGGATVIIDPMGEIRYIIRKNIVSKSRRQTQVAYSLDSGARYWKDTPNGQMVRQDSLFQLLHGKPKEKDDSDSDLASGI
jgi:hypothetical protein